MTSKTAQDNPPKLSHFDLPRLLTLLAFACLFTTMPWQSKINVPAIAEPSFYSHALSSSTSQSSLALYQHGEDKLFDQAMLTVNAPVPREYFVTSEHRLLLIKQQLTQQEHKEAGHPERRRLQEALAIETEKLVALKRHQQALAYNAASTEIANQYYQEVIGMLTVPD